MTADPKAVAKLSAEAKDAKKHALDAAVQIEKASGERHAALDGFAKALAKLKFDGDVKDADLSALSKAKDLLAKALVAEGKAVEVMERASDRAFIAADSLHTAQKGK